MKKRKSNINKCSSSSAVLNNSVNTYFNERKLDAREDNLSRCSIYSSEKCSINPRILSMSAMVNSWENKTRLRLSTYIFN